MEEFMYKCPNCSKLEKSKYNKVIRCECGVCKMLVKSTPPYYIQVQESMLDENRNKLYNKTKLER